MYLRNIRSRNVYTPRRNFRALFDRKINGVFTYRRKERIAFSPRKLQFTNFSELFG